jgi:PPE-repeat protein
MYGYAGASATASPGNRFTAPPQTTNSSGLMSQSVAATQSAGTPGGNRSRHDHVVWPASHFGNASSPAEPGVAAGPG